MGLQPAKAEIRSSVRNVKNARTWAQRVNVRRVRFALMKNAPTYTLSRDAKLVVLIIATIALLNKGEREKRK